MPSFSKRSKTALASAHPLLQKLFNEVIKEFDCVITESRRGKAEQEKAFKGGFSKAHYGDSAHNYSPAIALDVYPYPIIWDREDYRDKSAFKKQAEVVLRAAKKLGIPIRWGGDWNMNNKADEKFVDMPHFELTPWRTYAQSSKLYRG